jgi:ribulose-phosphate 3-epimerase
MATIVPAILESESSLLQDRLSVIEAFKDLQRMQIDFSDGKFTKYKTVSATDIKGLPEAVLCEAHLMVENPQSYFAELKSAGFKMVIIHFEAVNQKELAEIAGAIRSMQMLAGLAISTETPLQEVLSYLNLFDQVTLLTVVPGQQGQSMDPYAIERINELTSYIQFTGAAAKVEIDGGISAKNIGFFAGLGVDYIVAGSAIFDVAKGLSPEKNFEALQKQATV